MQAIGLHAYLPDFRTSKVNSQTKATAGGYLRGSNIGLRNCRVWQKEKRRITNIQRNCLDTCDNSLVGISNRVVEFLCRRQRPYHGLEKENMANKSKTAPELNAVDH